MHRNLDNADRSRGAAALRPYDCFSEQVHHCGETFRKNGQVTWLAVYFAFELVSVSP